MALGHSCQHCGQFFLFREPSVETPPGARRCPHCHRDSLEGIGRDRARTIAAAHGASAVASRDGPPDEVFGALGLSLYVLALVVVVATNSFFAIPLWIVMPMLVYNDRRGGVPDRLAWSLGTFALGPFVFVPYVLKRREVRGAPNSAPRDDSSTAERPMPPPPPPVSNAEGTSHLGALAPPTVAPPADWHPDPTGEARLRYWNGSSWTHHIAS